MMIAISRLWKLAINHGKKIILEIPIRLGVQCCWNVNDHKYLDRNIHTFVAGDCFDQIFGVRIDVDSYNIRSLRSIYDEVSPYLSSGV